MADNSDHDAPLPFGVSADTGRPLAPLIDDAVSAMIRRESKPNEETASLTARGGPAGLSFAVEGGVDANDLGQAGWGVIYGRGVDPSIKQALAPLLAHRKAQAAPFKIFEGPDGYLEGDTAAQWLARRGVRMDVVDPENGVPFYLLIVAAPDEIPFEFQYALDLYWATGRLWFDTADEFRHYADSVVAYETATAVPTGRHAVMFATEHDFDAATQLFTRQVARPLAGQDGTSTPVWTRGKFGLRTLFGGDATKEALADVMRGKEHRRPALLFSGSHGMEFNAGDQRQRACQGAIVCQDWNGFGAITKQHWFAASDVPDDARLHGMIHFLFACHGGGCPGLDNYDRLNNAPRRIAPAPFFAQLPQRMLAHSERAWAYSFQGARGGSQVQGFRDVIGRLLRGERIGQATDMFNLRWAALSVELAELQIDLGRGADVPLRTLGNLWIARDDARNFMVLGDPAVRLRVEDMPA